MQYMVCLVHLMRGHKTITGTFTYSNSEYHHVGNAFNFKPRYCKSHMLLFSLCLDRFSFNSHLSFLKFYGTLFT